MRQAMPTIRHEDSRLHEGMRYPLGFLAGVLPDGQEAEQTAQSLYAAGFIDVVVLDGPPALEALESTERAPNPPACAWERPSLYLSDEDDVRQAALDAWGQGRAIVLVWASGGAQEEQAEGILRAHGAHAVRSFGRWSITEPSR
jgi:hypothetical protein